MLDLDLGEVEVIIHATEDQDKLLDAIKGTLKIDNNKFVTNILEGYYGNEIRLISARLDPQEATDLASLILNSLNKYNKNNLVNNLRLYIDKNSLYLRISKQDIFKNRIILSDEDPIRLRFRFKNIKPSLEFNIKEYLKDG